MYAHGGRDYEPLLLRSLPLRYLSQYCFVSLSNDVNTVGRIVSQFVQDHVMVLICAVGYKQICVKEILISWSKTRHLNVMVLFFFFPSLHYIVS
jgi:hypothetical protein